MARNTGRYSEADQRGYRNKSDDKETQAILYEGANKSQLSTLFQMDSRKINERLFKLPPNGRRHGADIWFVHSAAPYLVKPGYDIEQYIRRMNPADLPPLLSKEFWAGQRAKQSYEEEEGDLWRTDDVIEAVNDMIKLVRMSLLLLPDQMAKSTTLTVEQREIVQKQCDGILTEMRNALIRHFADRINTSGSEEDEEDEEEDFSDL